MKRCPQCNRVETDEALKFCRVDGATLSDSASVNREAETVQLGSSSSGEIGTNIVPHRTDANVDQPTAATIGLSQQPPQTTIEPGKPNRRWNVEYLSDGLTDSIIFRFSLAKERYVSAYSFAIVYEGLGDKEKAFQWLEKGYQD